MQFTARTPQKALVKAVVVALIGYSLIFGVFSWWVRSTVISSYKDHQAQVSLKVLNDIEKYFIDRDVSDIQFEGDERRHFDRVIKSETYGRGVRRLRLFNVVPAIVYASDTKSLNEVVVTDLDEVRVALLGDYHGEMGNKEEGTAYYEFFGPIRDKLGNIIGVGEIYFDIGNLIHDVNDTTVKILISSLVSFCLFTVVVFFYSLGLFRRMESIRESQIESERKARELHDVARAGTFVAGLAHQLRNPIAILSGVANSLMKREVSEDQRPFIEALAAETKRMSDLVDQFLKFARPLNRDLSNAQTVLADCCKSVCTELTRHFKTEIVCTIEDRIIVALPRGLLCELFDVLIRNGVASAIQGTVSKIEISARENGKWVEVDVKDNGIGLTDKLAADPTLAFQPFFTTKTNGSGLGLALARRIVEEFGGKIYIEQNKDSGITVKFTLPRVEKTYSIS